jgi:beta-lactamase regulating signal transducer with metallopeptidase domain
MPLATVPPSTAATGPDLSLLPWLGGAYVALLLGFILRWLFGCLALARLVSSAQPPPPEVVRLFAAMTAHLRRRPRLLVAERIAIPLSCGVWQPTVILSPGLCRPEAREVLRWVFAHELTHLERRDAWSSHLFGLAQAVYFFLPWFWWLRHQVRLCQEFVADAAACPTGAAAEYAQFLLNLRRAPAVPTRALGVSGNPSDLYRRVNMLLQSSQKVERSCPRVWSLAAAGAVLAGALFVSGLGLKAEANPVADGDNEEPKKAEPAKPDKEAPKEEAENLVRELQKLIQQIQQPAPGAPANPEELQKRMQQLMERLARLQAAQRAGIGVGPVGPGGAGLPGIQWQFAGPLPRGGGRLGISGSAPSKVLADQLDLPGGKGLVIDMVSPDSAAAKAGLKVHDILLQLDGKDVPNHIGEVARIVEDIKANTPVDAVVLRKGKKETIRGITLGEKDRGAGRGILVRPELVPPGVPVAPGFPGAPGQPPMIPNPLGGLPPGAGGFGGFPGNGVMTSVFRTDDRFTTRHQEGTLIITLTGKIADGKATLSEISVQDGGVSSKYESIEKVPEQYRDKAKNLLEMSEKSSVKIEIRKR